MLNGCNWFKSKTKSYEELQIEFFSKFNEIILPFNLDESIVSTRSLSESLDSALIDMFLEKNNSTLGKSKVYDWYKFLAVNQFKYKKFICIIFLKERKFGDLNSEYYLNVYSNGKLISNMLIAKLSGNCKNMNIKTSIITTENIFVFDKKIIFTQDCKRIIKSDILSEIKFKIDDYGNIVQNNLPK